MDEALLPPPEESFCTNSHSPWPQLTAPFTTGVQHQQPYGYSSALAVLNWSPRTSPIQSQCEFLGMQEKSAEGPLWRFPGQTPLPSPPSIYVWVSVGDKLTTQLLSSPEHPKHAGLTTPHSGVGPCNPFRLCLAGPHEVKVD